MSADVLTARDGNLGITPTLVYLQNLRDNYKIRAESKLKYVLMKNGTGGVPAIEAVWCNEALQQIADVAADLLTNVLNY